jgi:hypothetical protein
MLDDVGQEGCPPMGCCGGQTNDDPLGGQWHFDSRFLSLSTLLKEAMSSHRPVCLSLVTTHDAALESVLIRCLLD